MEAECFTSVWDALEDSPADAANMKVRSDILIALQEEIDGWGVTREEAAERLSVTLPRLDELLGNNIHRFDIEALLTLAIRANLKVEWHITPNAA